MLPSKVSNL
ncbi:hypothetical protein LINPERPRIM_LOCUS26794 [Linum perenne]